VVEGNGVCGINDGCEDGVCVVIGNFADELPAKDMAFDFNVHAMGIIDYYKISIVRQKTNLENVTN
jgi:hypothetical protein